MEFEVKFVINIFPKYLQIFWNL